MRGCMRERTCFGDLNHNSTLASASVAFHSHTFSLARQKMGRKAVPITDLENSLNLNILGNEAYVLSCSLLPLCV